MSSNNKYINYLKDNPNRYWFKRKIWGWGWTPATWEGWLVTLIFIAAVLANAIRFENATLDGSGNVDVFLLQILGLIALFVVIAWRTGESPKWQWGFPKEDNE